MADSPSAISVPVSPKIDAVATITLPNTPTSIALTDPLSAVEPGLFLKPTSPRKRPRSPDFSPPPSSITNNLRLPPGPISPHKARPGSPLILTAAAEMAEQKKRKLETERDQARQQSPNPQRNALGALIGTPTLGMSRRQDAPSAATTLSTAIAAVAPSITIPTQTQGEASVQTSPVSMSSFGTLDSTGATTMTAIGPRVASPGQIGEADPQEAPPEKASRRGGVAVDVAEGSSSKAFTYPGPLLAADPERRRMSMPASDFPRDDSKSPSTNKKHKCPYCSTEFTRHHNLKSHLLTHSHEKPYMCQTCDSRFRRLHDLKRHTKLHTGEKPHVCPKCRRSFARGDALARHNKGQGGCAGRRSSVGSYGGEGDDGGDDSMVGLMYGTETSHEPENMDEDAEGIDDPGSSLPRIRRQDPPHDPHYRQPSESSKVYQPRQPSTYPPVAGRPSTVGGLYPPSGSHPGGPSASTSPGTQTSGSPQYAPGSSVSSVFQVAVPNMFAQGGMTESPKPLSPGQGSMSNNLRGLSESSISRNRSPSLTQQFQQQQYGRRTQTQTSQTQGTPPSMSLNTPLSSISHSNAPHLPSLPGLTPPDPRYTLHSQASGQSQGLPHSQPAVQQANHPGQAPPPGAPPPSGYHQQTGISSHSNSLSSHGTGHHGSGERSNLPYPPGDERLWAIVRGLEAKVDRLQEEVTMLRGQLSTQPQQQQQQRHHR